MGEFHYTAAAGGMRSKISLGMNFRLDPEEEC
jgi:hypothetical protein